MRIVGGAFKGRALKAPTSQNVRPTTDRAREALFNILTHNDDLFAEGRSLEGALVIDLFAGTGALGLEALSRGAAFALFVDNSIEGRGLIRENMQACGVAARARLFKRDATKIGERGKMEPATLAFLDPPYGKGLGENALNVLHDGRWLAPSALVIVEESVKAGFNPPAPFESLQTREMGETQLSFLRYDNAR
ncbi:MAG: 16S rRNA (guanine(966)-N(2))-methyltransferase RsmD [Hyphomicrobiales bacterium]|jgi:16S rRNA (guanine966-N2)-methyltransferase